MSGCHQAGGNRWRVVERLSIDDHDFESSFDTHHEAYLAARRFACCRGAVYVRVYDPGDQIAHEWSRNDNRWLAYLPHPT